MQLKIKMKVELTVNNTLKNSEKFLKIGISRQLLTRAYLPFLNTEPIAAFFQIKGKVSFNKLRLNSFYKEICLREVLSNKIRDFIQTDVLR
jgi:hypothetical protein